MEMVDGSTDNILGKLGETNIFSCKKEAEKSFVNNLNQRRIKTTEEKRVQ